MDLDAWIERAQRCEILEESIMKTICNNVKAKIYPKLNSFEQLINFLVEEPNIINIHAPATICGDVHGQFYDVMRLFEVGGQLPSTNYVFLVSNSRKAKPFLTSDREIMWIEEGIV